MDQIINHPDLLFNLIMTMDIEDLYRLYHTSHFIQNYIDKHDIMMSLSEKYDANYDSYDKGYYHFNDLVWDVIVNKIGFNKRNIYLKDEIVRAVAVINNRYLNSGDKITNCLNKSYRTEWICQAAAFLKVHLYGDIYQIIEDLDNANDKKEKNIIYETWLKSLKLKTIVYFFNAKNTLLDNPFTSYNGYVEK